MVWEKQQQSNWSSQQANPESYLDMAIRSIISLPNDLIQKEQSLDMAKYFKMRFVLIEQLENIAMGAKKIRSLGKEYDHEDLNENQKALRVYLMDYFRKENPDWIKGGAAPKADAVMRFITSGAYPTKIDLKNQELQQQVAVGKIDQELAKDMLSNYKLQVIIASIQNSKARVIDLEV